MNKNIKYRMRENRIKEYRMNIEQKLSIYLVC